MVSHSNDVYLYPPYLSSPLDSEQLEVKELFLAHLSILRTYPGPGTGKSVLRGRENGGQKHCDKEELASDKDHLSVLDEAGGLPFILCADVPWSASYSRFQKTSSSSRKVLVLCLE